jgi:hypothetical protein
MFPRLLDLRDGDCILKLSHPTRMCAVGLSAENPSSTRHRSRQFVDGVQLDDSVGRRLDLVHMREQGGCELFTGHLSPVLSTCGILPPPAIRLAKEWRSNDSTTDPT